MNKEKIAKILKTIFINDKTEYDYFSHLQRINNSKRSANRFGNQPPKGKRWNTPAEIASDTLKELGYNHPNDVKEISKCACPDSDPIICTLLRYPEYRGDREKVMEIDAECQCCCHDFGD